MQELLRWLNGWVYALFGADGLVAFSAHPLLYAAGAAALALAIVLGGAWWLSRRFAALRARVRLALALALSADGRRCLRLARQIRGGAVRLRHAIRTEIRERGERRELLRVLERFAHGELHGVLEHALRLIRQADDREAEALRLRLERQTRAWGAAASEGEREALQRDIAETRHHLAQARAAVDARDAHLRGLEEAAGAVQALESQLGELHLTRSRALPEFRDHLSAAAHQLSHLSAAYRELQEPR